MRLRLNLDGDGGGCLDFVLLPETWRGCSFWAGGDGRNMLRVRVVLGVEECSSDSGEEIDGATVSGIGLVGVESSVSEKLKSMREARFLGEPGASRGIRCEFILLKKVDMVSSPFGLAAMLSCSGRAGVARP